MILHTGILGQGRVNHQGIEKDDSLTPWELCEKILISFGLTYVPAAFQRYVEDILEGIQEKCCAP